jgi:hypothetical protein
MKTLFAVIAGCVVVCSAEAAHAQFAVGFFGPPAVVAPPPVVVAPPAPVVVAPPAPVVTYYSAPAVAYAPGYYVAPAPLLPAPLYYSVRQRTYLRGPYYRSTLRIRGW